VIPAGPSAAVRVLLLVAFGLGLRVPSARAWQGHASLMPAVWTQLPAAVRARLEQPQPAPCPEAERERLSEWAAEFRFAAVAPTLSRSCGEGATVRPRDILFASVVDEPDRGLDPDPARHEWFGGWTWRRPIGSLQWPLSPVGGALDRARTLAERARGLIRAGNVSLAMRLLGWSMHYLQDLADPFATDQIPALRMVPWYVGLQWPPAEAWADLRAQTGRSLRNYRIAYSRYVARRLEQPGGIPPFADCLADPVAHARLDLDFSREDAGDLARRVATRSAARSAAAGSGAFNLFGEGLKLRDQDLARGRSALKYDELAIRPDLAGARARLEDVTCESLADAVLASRLLVIWAFQP
jgi:hypothetical protein